MKNYITKLAILLTCLVLSQTAFADVKVKIRQTMSGQSYENTTYIKGKRERAEQNTGGMQMINITQCDLKRSLQIMPASQTYLINTWEQAKSVAPTTAATTTKTPTEKGGVVTMTSTIKDTGERKQMFGYTARHLIITMETESSPDACTPVKSKMQTDGWYIDATFALDCQMEQANAYRPNTTKTSGCQDRYQMKQIGVGKRGYPVYEKMTMFDESGKETYSFVNEVVELSNTTLDAALFDAPAGYREVKDSTELYASMRSGSQGTNNYSAMQSAGNDENQSNNFSAMSQNVKNMAAKNPTNTGAEVGAKKAGVLRVGLAGVKTGAVGEGMNAAELSRAIQNSLSEYLKSPNVELVQLEAKLPSAIDSEAKQKDCDFVIYAQISHKKGGSGGFGFGKMLGSVVGQTGIGHTGSVAGNIAGQMATTAIVSAGQMSANVKAKDEITLDIKVDSASGAAALARQFKAKAKGDGDDIITQAVEQAAQAIIDAIGKK